jgi:phospholipase/carboxylesterase
LQTIVKELTSSADAAVIWLHGLGADGNDFVDVLKYLNLTEDQHIRFVFPSAPMRSVTINNGLQMRSWYDIKAMLPARVIDENELDQSISDVNNLIAEQVAQGIAANRIILIGFSQGGALAYETALTTKLAIAGVAAMSTYLPRLLTKDQCHLRYNAPVLSIHGEQDGVVPSTLGESSVKHLESLGYAPAWHTFAMSHEVSLQSLAVLGQWITSVLDGADS